MSPPLTDAVPAFRRDVVVAALLLAISMAAMEATVVATAMPTIVAELGGVRLYAWVGASYLLASTVTVPLYGRLADMFGRKRVFLVGVGLFVVGSIACGAAPTVEWLVLARALQGLGAGAIQPVALTIVGDLFRIEERSKVQGMFGAVWAAAGVLGPMLGAFFVHTLSWRWVFWVNVPFGAAAAMVLALSFHETASRAKDASLDVGGAILVTGASVALLLGASGTMPMVTVAAGVGLALAFVAVEARVRSPMLPIAFVTRRPIAVATLASFFFGVVMMALLIYIPLYVQGARSGTPIEGGAVVAPTMFGWPIASTLTSRLLVRIGFRKPLWAGALVVAASLGILVVLARAHAPLFALGTAMFFFGAGMGLANTSLIIAVQSTVGFAQRGVSTALALFARTMGGALGVGALGALVTHALAERLPPGRVAEVLSRGRELDTSVLESAATALDDALAPLFLVCAAVAVANLLVVALWPRTLETVED